MDQNKKSKVVLANVIIKILIGCEAVIFPWLLYRRPYIWIYFFIGFIFMLLCEGIQSAYNCVEEKHLKKVLGHSIVLACELYSTIVDKNFFVTGLILFVFMLYEFVTSIRYIINLKANISRDRKKKIRKLSVLIIVFVFACLIASPFIVYRMQPDVSEKTVPISLEKDGGSLTNKEYVKIIDDNAEALNSRLQMINMAKEEIILSTFDFRDDNSGKIVMGALAEAANRGVDVYIIVDGMTGMLSMKWNPYFYALSTLENVQIKLYNEINPFALYKAMGRLHDKYLIVDKTMYIAGGRNTYDYFLGNFGGYKNYDRDVQVVDSEKEQGSVKELVDYFSSVWNYKESKSFGESQSLKRRSIVNKDRSKIISEYQNYKKNNEFLVDCFLEMSEAKTVRIISNPISVEAKEPVGWFQLMSLMKGAENSIKIHTPYIICNSVMYQDIADLCDSVKSVQLMTNSVGNNGNPFGAADYDKYKINVINTGLEVLEYEGGISYHGKSILIDDNISIIGSFNFDMRSAYLDTEIMVVIESKEVNQELLESMVKYENSSRIAKSDGSYENPNQVVPIEKSVFDMMTIKVIQALFGWTRYLF